MNATLKCTLLAQLLSLVAIGARAESFDTFHPDQSNQKKGFELYGAGEAARSVPYFRRAARYADKPSQLALAMMYWTGEGVEKDPALAYAWADLAAERHYRAFLITREQIWASLDTAQQERAIAEGARLYAEFGDDVAKRRLENLLRIGKSQRTGTRAGSLVPAVGVVEFDSSARAAYTAAFQTSALHGSNTIAIAMRTLRAVSSHTSEGYYDDRHWRPVQYWHYQDSLWNPTGTVEVLPLRSAKSKR